MHDKLNAKYAGSSKDAWVLKVGANHIAEMQSFND